jgi:hypothetical protein
MQGNYQVTVNFLKGMEIDKIHLKVLLLFSEKIVHQNLQIKFACILSNQLKILHLKIFYQHFWYFSK